MNNVSCHNRLHLLHFDQKKRLAANIGHGAGTHIAPGEFQLIFPRKKIEDRLRLRRRTVLCLLGKTKTGDECFFFVVVVDSLDVLERAARSCGAPSQVQYGHVEGDCFAFGCRVTYACQDGFELFGRANRYCQADGTWTPFELPICVRKFFFLFLPSASSSLSPYLLGVVTHQLGV